MGLAARDNHCMTRRCLVIAAVIFATASLARADIYEWRDASGARHFTNNKAGVPSEYQESARVLISDWQASAAAATAPATLAPPAPAAPAAEMVSDAPQELSDAYLAGVRAGMTLGGGGGGSVQINGPLAISDSHAADTTPAYGYGYYPPWPWYYPFVTTSFDRGRSRHQTLRMLLQDQFQLDRDGPFAYQRWTQPGLGPALAPFLNRGLPFPVQQYGRVIYR